MNAQAVNDGEELAGRRSVARYAPTVARVLMGLVFLASGGFGIAMALGIVPVPAPSGPQSPGATALFAALFKTYLLPLIKVTEFVVGVLLLSNRFVPLALTLIAPIIVNIFAVHALLAPSGLPVAIALVVLESYLAWAYRDAFRSVLAARAKAT